MFDETALGAPKPALFRALTFVSIKGEQFGHNQHFRAQPDEVKDLLESGQIEPADDN